MNDARCFELYSVQGMQRKDVAEVMGVTVREVRNSLERHACSQRAKLKEDRKKAALEAYTKRRVSLHEASERLLFEKHFPDAPAEWWPVWLARSMVK